MLTYKAPLQDMSFVMNELFDYGATVASLPGFADATAETVDAVLEAAARFCEGELLPLNGPASEEGCHFENGVVRTPKGFRQAYAAFARDGWLGICCDPDHGGQGLPRVVGFALKELICATNVAFGAYPGLSQAAYDAIATHGDDKQKKQYLPRLADGSWAGTMCLTEPQCGTDLGLVRTSAKPNGDGGYTIDGTKIFISAGEHDLTENIVHLVLARLPDAPPGIRGISLFLVPKLLPGANGAALKVNGVTCGSIEHKMGIAASSTCVMHFSQAEGSLLGAAHGGMRAMFTMMNEARLGVGMQGLGLAETAYQSAAAYARERLQGRALKGAKFPDRPADPILVHPDIAKTLLTMRAATEGARALALWVGMEIDVAEKHPDEARRQEADDLVALMTPIIKSYFTDHGFAAANLGLQVFGGHGYIRETGMEQLVRDARIAQLYEGANGIQSLDLVGRKMGLHVGRLLRRFFHPVSAFIEANMEDAGLRDFVIPLAKSFGRLQQASAWVAEEGLKDADEAAAAAGDYLRLFALTALAYMWARMAKVAQAALDGGGGDRDAFYKAKLAHARFFMARVLPETSALAAAIRAGAGVITDVEEDWF